MSGWVAVDCAPSGPCSWQMTGGDAGSPQTWPAGTSPAEVAAAFPGRTVVACGAAAAPLSNLPSTPSETAPVAVQDGLYLVPGLRQAEPALEMRGGETRIAGFLSLNPSWDGVICLPGPRSHWALVSAREVVSFQSFLSGEMIAALSATPSLSGIGGAWDADTFHDALSESLSRPERMASRLASLGPEDAARLVGLVLGGEMAAARPYWLGQQVAVIGAGDAARPYVAALEAQGVPVTQTDETRMVLAGLTAAWRRIGGAK